MYSSNEALTTHDAAKIACVTQRTILRWCDQYSLGKKIGGKYRVDPRTLEDFLSGKHDRTSIGPWSVEVVR